MDDVKQVGRRPGQISAATERAIARVEAGATRYAAAKAEGIALTTIYRAMKRLTEQQTPIKP